MNKDTNENIEEEVVMDENPRVFMFRRGHGRHGKHFGPPPFVFKMGKGCCAPGQMKHRFAKHDPLDSVFQKVVGDTLKVAIILPGIDKETLKLRAKSDSLILDATGSKRFEDVLGEREYSLKVNLIEKIDPATVKAKYDEGILLLEAPVEGVEEINIE